MLRKGVAALMVIFGLATWVSTAGNAQTTAVTTNDAAWITSSQLPDGALTTYPDKQYISPYLANLSAVGLARATGATGDAAPADAAWRWLSWYQAHMDGSGFVTDYVVRDGIEASTGDMDSTDAYAGTFLLATAEVFRVTRDQKRLSTLRDGITRAVGAIEATQDVDGLTWAKPTWKVKYLMDQSEVWGGLRAAYDLAGALGDAQLAQHASADAARLRTGVSNLWNASVGAYDWAVHENGTRTATDWTMLYPDALQQAWAVAFSLVDGPRAASIMTQFATSQPLWAQPSALARYRDGTRTVGYWAPVGWAFAQIGRPDVAAAAATTIRSAAEAAGHAWPYSTGDAGELIVLDQPVSSGSSGSSGSTGSPAAPRQKTRGRS